MKILALDSSAVSASAAVLDDDKVLGEFFINTKQTHSQTLMPMVQQVLIQTKTSLEEMDLFAVSAGPGSFTGVRIGVACVKGMAFAQNKPCIGVSTLEAMAYPLSMLNGIICAVMDARCQQVYHALFRVNGIEVERICDDCAVAISDLAESLQQYSNETIYLLGDGAKLCYESEAFQPLQVRLVAEHLQYQRAVGVAQCAALHLKQEDCTVTAEQLAPVYLRLPQAERELKKKLEGTT